MQTKYRISIKLFVLCFVETELNNILRGNQDINEKTRGTVFMYRVFQKSVPEPSSSGAA